MSFLAFLAADDVTQTPSKFWPEGYEMLFGIPASVIVFFLLWKFAGPTVKKGMAAARQRSRLSSMPVRRIESRPMPRRPRSVRPRATSTPNVPGCWPTPTPRRQRCSKTAGPGSTRRSPSSRQAPPPTSPPPPAGPATSCAPRSPACPAPPSTRSSPVTLDDATHQALIEDFIAGSEPQQEQRHERSRIDGYARGLFEIARAEGTLDEVEDELFRFARSYESSEELRNALTDEQIPAEQASGDRRGPARRQGDADHDPADLDGRRLRPGSRPAGDHRPPRRPGIDGQEPRGRRGAHRRRRSPPTSRRRLAAALANATGKQVNLKVIVDPSVLGGLVATVGDTVIDGTVRTRIDQLKSRL